MNPFGGFVILGVGVRAVEFVAGFPASGLDRTSWHPSRVVPELQSFFVFVVLARGTDRQSTALKAVAFRAILAFVRIIPGFPELVALRKDSIAVLF